MLRTMAGQVTRTIAAVALVVLAAPCMAGGQFVVRPPEVKTRALRQELKEMDGQGVLQALADAVNTLFVIPQDVGLKFLECEESNAYFSADDMEISMCIELMDDMDNTLKESYPDDDERADAVGGAFMQIAMHEVGHALVAVLEIPITGREEDAVDQLSSWVLIESEMGDAVLSAAATYYTAEQTADDEDVADEHSLNNQRYFNMVCWVYGSKPEENENLIEEWGLPQARADQCEAEYQQLRRSWARLLDGHLRE